MISEQFPWLTTIVLFPFLASLPIPFLPGNDNKVVRSYALAAGLAEFALILFTFGSYYSLQDAGLQLVESYQWVPQIGLNWTVAADGLSMPLVILSGLVTTLAILASWNISTKPRLYYFLLLLMYSAQVGVFLCQDHPAVLPHVGDRVGARLLAHLYLGWQEASLRGNKVHSLHCNRFHLYFGFGAGHGLLWRYGQL
jgi:hypothetical protein